MKFKELFKAPKVKEKNSINLDIIPIFEEIKNTNDEIWGLYAFSKEPLVSKYSLNEKKILIDKAQKCGIEYAKKYKDKYLEKGLFGILNEFNIKFKKISEENSGHQVIFAQYIEPDQIEVFELHLKTTLDKFKEKHIQFTLSDKLEFILISHELFHVIEYYNKEIFTQTYKKTLWKIGNIYSYKSKILSISEIAAMSFTKELLDLDYNPYMLDILMVYPYNEEYMYDLYKDLKNAKENLC